MTDRYVFSLSLSWSEPYYLLTEARLILLRKIANLRSDVFSLSFCGASLLNYTDEHPLIPKYDDFDAGERAL